MDLGFLQKQLWWTPKNTVLDRRALRGSLWKSETSEVISKHCTRVTLERPLEDSHICKLHTAQNTVAPVHQRSESEKNWKIIFQEMSSDSTQTHSLVLLFDKNMSPKHLFFIPDPKKSFWRPPLLCVPLRSSLLGAQGFFRCNYFDSVFWRTSFVFSGNGSCSPRMCNISFIFTTVLWDRQDRRTLSILSVSPLADDLPSGSL